MTAPYYERAKQALALLTREATPNVKIPELKLTPQASSEPLIQRKQTIESILHAGNTTIIPIRDISSRNFLGLSVLNANLGSEEHYVNPWQAEDVGEICQHLGKVGISGRITRKYIEMLEYANNDWGGRVGETKQMEVPINMILLNDAPPHLRPSLKRFMSDARIYAEAPIQDLHGRFTSLLLSISTNLVANGKYLVLRDEEGTTQVIQLKDDSGNYLLPRNWLRVPMSYWTTSSLPPDLHWYIDQLTADRTSRFKELRSDLVAVTNSGSVRLVKRADGNHIDCHIDHLGNVGSNVCVDPENSSRVYYCGGDYSSLEVVDLSETKPVQERRNLTKPYHNVHNIQIDPSGKFILISTEDGRGHNSVQVLRKDTLEPVGVIPNLSDVSYDHNGLLHGVDGNGRLGTFTLNFDQIWASIQENMHARLDTARQALLNEVTQQLEGAISFNQVLGVDKALQARLAGLGKQYNPAEFHYLTQSVQDLINTRRSMLATQEIQTILYHRIETALKAPVSINVEISLSRYKAQLEARLHYLDAGKDTVLIAQARNTIQMIDQRRARFVESQAHVVGDQIGAAVRIITDEINALTLESFTSFILAERIKEIEGLLARMGIEYRGLVPLEKFRSVAQNELITAFRARATAIQTEATSAVVTPALVQLDDMVRFQQTLGRTLIDVFVETLRASRPRSLDDIKRSLGYTALQQQLNGLDQKLSAELDERIELYFQGVKIMESDIELVDGQLTKKYYDDELKVDVRLPKHSAGEYPLEVRALISEWDPKWVLDDWTLKQLSKIATAVALQLKTNSGAIFLKGPPGVGKDELIKILSAMLERPLYTLQGGQSMDEETLYGNVSFVADSKGTNSVVSRTLLHDGCLQGNSLVYVEEANAIKESGQIALHKLLAERRIPAGAYRDATPVAQGVTIFMSGNIGNGGTHPIEAALLNRLAVIDIEKPPFINPKNKQYFHYEAMRGANITPTLSSLVREGQFPSVWDYYVNGKGDQPGVALSTKQLFDLETIFKILQIGNELWTYYLKINEGGKGQAEAMRTCPAILPFTRDFNMCVGALSFYPQGGDATATARLLLNRFYAGKLDNPSQIKAVKKFIDGYPCSELINH